MRTNKVDTETFRNSLQEIIVYMWKEEREDYFENEEPEGHIFEHLKLVDSFISEVEVRR